MAYQQAFVAFMAKDFEAAVISSTVASWANDYYVVELFEDGSYRVMGSNNMGNVYVSKGLVLRIPSLSDCDWDEENHDHYFGNAEEYMRDTLAEALYN